MEYNTKYQTHPKEPHTAVAFTLANTRRTARIWSKYAAVLGSVLSSGRGYSVTPGSRGRSEIFRTRKLPSSGSLAARYDEDIRSKWLNASTC